MRLHSLNVRLDIYRILLLPITAKLVLNYNVLQKRLYLLMQQQLIFVYHQYYIQFIF